MRGGTRAKADLKSRKINIVVIADLKYGKQTFLSSARQRREGEPFTSGLKVSKSSQSIKVREEIEEVDEATTLCCSFFQLFAYADYLDWFSWLSKWV